MMLGKLKEKKAAKMYHTRNFGTGYVEADYYYLSRVGLRGRKRWLLLFVLVLAYIIVIGHLMVSSLCVVSTYFYIVYTYTRCCMPLHTSIALVDFSTFKSTLHATKANMHLPL